MVLWLQERLALLNQEDLSISAMLEHWIDLPTREGVYAPRIPGYLASLDRNRRAKMLDRVANDPKTKQAVRQTWMPLFNPVPKPSVFSEEEWAKMNEDGLTANIESVEDSVAKIIARGGRVIFMLLPSNGKVLELERKYTPRANVWDRLLRETAAPGIHFEEHAELQGFDCPEWSHLSAADSVEFSKRLVRVMQAEGLLPGAR